MVTLAVLALRLPFLQQAIQGDDVFYLYGAERALIDPLHPTHVSFAFMGRMVDMRGHPHPPFDVWYLGALLALKLTHTTFSVSSVLGLLVLMGVSAETAIIASRTSGMATS